MANTMATNVQDMLKKSGMPDTSNVEIEPGETRMNVTAAMDVLDEFRIRRGDMQRVYDALETLLEPAEETEADESETPPDDSAMMSSVFAKGGKQAA